MSNHLQPVTSWGDVAELVKDHRELEAIVRDLAAAKDGKAMYDATSAAVAWVEAHPGATP